MGLGVQVELCPTDECFRCLSERRAGLVIHSARCSIIRTERAESETSYLAGEFRSVVGVDHRASVHQSDGSSHIENLGTFNEERAQFAEEKWVPLVHFDLRPVGFDLGKVRIDSEVGCQIGCESVL